MVSEVILALDQGTTNTKALLLNMDGRALARATRPQSPRYPQPSWIEQDPAQIWQNVRAVIDECLCAVSIPALAAIAITNQRETIMLWERRTSRPLGPCIVWQCRRTAAYCDELRARGLEPFLRERTGLTIDPLFSAT